MSEKYAEEIEMIKFIGILCIFAASSASGLAMSDRIKCTRNRFEKERKMLEEISVMIRFSSLTLREIADELNRSDTYSEIGFVRLLVSKAEQTCFPKAWKESVLGDRNLTESERKLFLELGESLGTTDAEGQLSTIDIYKARLDDMIEQESEKYRVKGKMYRSLGIMFGAMIGILII